ncbi:MAG: preprotein translocase subunit SecG [Ruminococcus sp.]|nr:preprotein translocase subunit SecG [Ruminococcus sp.]
MGALQIILGALLILFCVLIILVVVLQEGHQQGLGVITGAADSFFSKNKARSWDAFLARWTKLFALGFVIFVLALDIIANFL